MFTMVIVNTLHSQSEIWKSKKLLKVTPQMCQGRDLQTWGMHWITVHAGLTLPFFSRLLDHTYGVCSRCSAEENKLQRSGSQADTFALQLHWEPPQDGSAPLAAQLSSSGNVWGLPGEICNHTFDTSLTETQSSQWHKPACTVWPCQTDQGHQSTCPILPTKTEAKTVLTLGTVLMKEPGYSTGLELTLISC